jgi:hypothetical protein
MKIKRFQTQTPTKHEIVQDIKKMFRFFKYVNFLFFFSILLGSATTSSINRTYEMPDGWIITVNNECFHTPETLFKLAQIDFEETGVHKKNREKPILIFRNV